MMPIATVCLAALAADPSGSIESLSVRPTILARGPAASRELVLEVEIGATGPAGPGVLTAEYEGRSV